MSTKIELVCDEVSRIQDGDGYSIVVTLKVDTLADVVEGIGAMELLTYIDDDVIMAYLAGR